MSDAPFYMCLKLSCDLAQLPWKHNLEDSGGEKATRAGQPHEETEQRHPEEHEEDTSGLESWRESWSQVRTVHERRG